MWGHWEIIAIILVAILIFGPKKIPELMRGLGRGLKEFKDSMKEASPEETEKENHKEQGTETKQGGEKS